jgi:hypothetical protein
VTECASSAILCIRSDWLLLLAKAGQNLIFAPFAPVSMANALAYPADRHWSAL